MKIANQKDFATGAFYCAFGALTALGASQYEMGSTGAMGPGYFPLLAGILLAGLGLVVLKSSFGPSAATETLGLWNLRKVAIVVASVVLFAAALEPLGVFVAIVLLTGASSLASSETKLYETALLAVGLCVLVWVIFIQMLGLPFPLFPEFL